MFKDFLTLLGIIVIAMAIGFCEVLSTPFFEETCIEVSNE